jgi:DNA helicase HerA-like ATPase
VEFGKVISTLEGPSPTFFAFAIAKGKKVSKDQFVRVRTEEGTMVAMVDNIIKSNRYYANPETVVETDNLEQLFQVDEWEFLKGEASPLGILADGRVVRPTVPPSPGDLVQGIPADVLSDFLGFDGRGLHIGEVLHHDVPVNLGLGRTFQKHMAILAMSGAGKSYLTSVLLEELLKRRREQGRVAVVMFDVHGEYAGLAEKPPKGFRDFSGAVDAVVDLKIPVPELSAWEISTLINMSSAQKEELDKVKRGLHGKLYDMRELADEVKVHKMNPKTKAALVRRLMGLHVTGLFAATEDIVTKRPGEKEEHHRLVDLIRPGRAVIFNLSHILSKRNKDLIVLWLSKELFNLRWSGRISPLVMFLEEAHNFIPEHVTSDEAPTKWMFEKIAREGRKFLCSLVVISQRPIKLSTTVLSQCNTHVIMRITNPYDLKHIGQSSEGITTKTEKSLTTLQVGEALIVGEAVRYPVFLKVRKRESWEKKSSDMELQAREFEDRMDQSQEELAEVKDTFL